MLHLHVIDELRTGGAQTHLLTMLREAVKAPGIEHRVVSLFERGELAGAVEQLGIPVQSLQLRPLFEQRRFFSALARMEDLIGEIRPDLVEAHLTWSRALALFAAWRKGVPRRIGFEHGDLYMNSWKFRAMNFATQFFSERIVVCSKALADWDHKTHGFLNSKLLVLHNCVDAELYSPNGSAAPDLSFPTRTTVFCAVGTLGKGVNKRVDVCIRALAVARQRGVEAVLLVCGDGEQRPDLEALARSLGVEEHVRFLGTRSDVPQVLRACDAFCHCAPFEPFGIVALEAMASGLPVIVPNSGGIREIVSDGQDGILYPALDHEALGERMMALAGDLALRRRLGIAGRRTVEERFTVSSYVSRLYHYYGIETGFQGR